MALTVRFTAGARKDLRSIHESISTNDSSTKADYVQRKIVEAAITLREHPMRGAQPPELLATGNRDYRQILFKPYRIVYKVRENMVYIAVIADGRRNMQTLLAYRLLEG